MKDWVKYYADQQIKAVQNAKGLPGYVAKSSIQVIKANYQKVKKNRQQYQARNQAFEQLSHGIKNGDRIPKNLLQ